MWLFGYPLRDATQYLSDQAYVALRVAGLYPAELAAEDARGRFWRLVRQNMGSNPRPDWMDVVDELHHLPIRDADR